MERRSTRGKTIWLGRLPLLAGFVVLVAVSLISAFFITGRFASSNLGTSAGNSDQITVQYSTEKGDNASQAFVDSPLNINLKTSGTSGFADPNISAMLIQLFDEQGKPAENAGKVVAPEAMNPAFESGVWKLTGSTPSLPGTYHAHLQVVSSATALQTPTTSGYDLQSPLLVVVSDPQRAMSGYVFASSSNLWLLSSDAARERRLTFYPSFDEYADKPSWSPDGKQIVFTYSPPTDPNKLPQTEIWGMKPDGGSLAALAKHADNESLYDAAWSPDGKKLYFTVETSTDQPSSLNSSGLPGGATRIDSVDLASGKRTTWKDGAQMPSFGVDGSSVYFENAGTPADTGSVAPERLVLLSPDGQTKKVLVSEKVYQLMYAPRISPDGKWVVFAAINVPPAPSGQLDLLKLLMIEPETALAHGLPWDLFLVPAAGGSPIQLTHVNEDQPFPAWLDSSTIVFNGVTGLNKLKIDAQGTNVGKMQMLHLGAPHGGLSWHQP
ncbi:MAG: hypothetical protein M3014_08505 [Chloroflexota bacterium]|nr:hypothetical protein [Chloroflexota bacterium]